MLFKFQWQIDKYSQDVGFGPVLSSISALRLISKEQSHTWWIYETALIK